MPDLLTSSAVAALRPLVATVSSTVSRLNAQRRAGRQGGATSDLMEPYLNETLDRLRGGDVDDSWWRRILHSGQQGYIAPDFLKTPALQEWLGQAQVGDDLKASARRMVLHQDADDSEIRARLYDSYSTRTGKAAGFARGPVETVVAILVAGYLAEIPSDQRALAGMVQAGFAEMRQDRADEIRQAVLTDPTTRKAHTDATSHELNRILLLRGFNPDRAWTRIRELHRQVENGNLPAAEESVKFARRTAPGRQEDQRRFGEGTGWSRPPNA